VWLQNYLSHISILERAAGIEPASSAWKAEVIAIIRCPHFSNPKNSNRREIWWREKDSNLRRQSRQIYSLIPLAARERVPLQRRSRVLEQFLGQSRGKGTYIISIAGSVAGGKSTTARILQALLERWPEHPRVELVTTDGFLYPNKELEERVA
jgi:hypothetical protein